MDIGTVYRAQTVNFSELIGSTFISIVLTFLGIGIEVRQCIVNNYDVTNFRYSSSVNGYFNAFFSELDLQLLYVVDSHPCIGVRRMGSGF